MGSLAVDATEKEGLRQRNAPLQAKTVGEARQTVLELNALEDKKDVADEKDKKVFGRTPDGTGKQNALCGTLYCLLTSYLSLHRAVHP